MSSPDPDRDLQTKQLIEAIMSAFATLDMPAIVVEPSDEPSKSRSAFSQLCFSENAVDPKRRLN